MTLPLKCCMHSSVECSVPFGYHVVCFLIVIFERAPKLIRLLSVFPLSAYPVLLIITMFSDASQECIVYISRWDSLKIHMFSFLCGFWVITKRFIRWVWKPNDFFQLQKRDAPPPCLVDSTLGRHSYMKLKVSNKLLKL
jgi:hypothetical protein